MSASAQATAGSRRLCAGTRRDGQPCQMTALRDDDYCYTHSPRRAEQRAASNRRGGERRSNAARTAKLIVSSDLQPVFARLTSAMDDLIAGRLEPAQATAAAQLARAMCLIFETVELGARLAALEAKDQERGDQ